LVGIVIYSRGLFRWRSAIVDTTEFRFVRRHCSRLRNFSEVVRNFLQGGLAR
jgi:hypothetical protein